jgi:hypothetical protein
MFRQQAVPVLFIVLVLDNCLGKSFLPPTKRAYGILALIVNYHKKRWLYKQHREFRKRDPIPQPSE